MEKSRIMAVLTDWNLWGSYRASFIERKGYLDRMEKFLSQGQVLVITGIRRAGKSALSYLLVKKLVDAGQLKQADSLFINFEDPRLPVDMQPEDILELYETYLEKVNPSKGHIVILDEVQRIEGWEKAARYLSENKGVQVIVTGSSSKLLSEEYSTVLSGRHLDIEVFPLSFREFLEFRGVGARSEVEIVKNRIKIRRLLGEYMEYGGFPEVVLKDEKEEILRAYLRDVILKDVIKRFSIKEMDKLEELARWYITNISTLQSFNKIRKYIKTSLDTVERFSKYLGIARLVFFAPKFGYSLKSQILSPRKEYIIDTGFFNVAGFKLSENSGRLYEDIAAIELVRNNKDFFYWKSGKQQEIDFVLREKTKIKKLIQVCYNIEEPSTKEREVSSLLKAGEELKCKDLLIITGNYEAKEKTRGKTVKFIPLWKWLLAKAP